MEDNVLKFSKLEGKHSVNDKWLDMSKFEFDRDKEWERDAVNSPAHYTRGRCEAIDVIEDAIADAPTVKAGFLQGQVLKYLLRLWLKVDSKEDAEKARWYLNRLIDTLG